MPLKAFIIRNQNQQMEHPVPQRKKRRARRFNDKGGLSLPEIHVGAGVKVNLHEMHGALEEQKILLQSLAMKENVVKGFSGCKLQSLSLTDLDYLKKETCILIQEAWNRSGRK